MCLNFRLERQEDIKREIFGSYEDESIRLSSEFLKVILINFSKIDDYVYHTISGPYHKTPYKDLDLLFDYGSLESDRHTSSVTSEESDELTINKGIHVFRYPKHINFLEYIRDFMYQTSGNTLGLQNKRLYYGYLLNVSGSRHTFVAANNTEAVFSSVNISSLEMLKLRKFILDKAEEVRKGMFDLHYIENDINSIKEKYVSGFSRS